MRRLIALALLLGSADAAVSVSASGSGTADPAATGVTTESITLPDATSTGVVLVGCGMQAGASSSITSSGASPTPSWTTRAQTPGAMVKSAPYTGSGGAATFTMTDSLTNQKHFAVVALTGADTASASLGNAGTINFNSSSGTSFSSGARTLQGQTSYLLACVTTFGNVTFTAGANTTQVLRRYNSAAQETFFVFRSTATGTGSTTLTGTWSSGVDYEGSWIEVRSSGGGVPPPGGGDDFISDDSTPAMYSARTDATTCTGTSIKCAATWNSFRTRLLDYLKPAVVNQDARIAHLQDSENTGASPITLGASLTVAGPFTGSACANPATCVDAPTANSIRTAMIEAWPYIVDNDRRIRALEAGGKASPATVGRANDFIQGNTPGGTALFIARTGHVGTCSGTTCVNEDVVNAIRDALIAVRAHILKQRADLTTLEAGATTYYSLTLSASGGTLQCNSGGGPGNCATTYASGTSVAITQTPSGSNTFTGWGGACSGTGSCVVVMSANRSVTATYSGGTTNCVTNQTILEDMTLPGVATNNGWSPNALDETTINVPSWADAMKMWGEVMFASGTSSATNTSVEIRNPFIYIKQSASSPWVKLQWTTDATGGGECYKDDFSGTRACGGDYCCERDESDGGKSMRVPFGYVFHFWPTSSGWAKIPGRSTGSKTQLYGVYTGFQAKLIKFNSGGSDDRANAHLVGQSAADYYQNDGSPCCSQATGPTGENGEAGMGRQKTVTNSYQWFTFLAGPNSPSRTGGGNAYPNATQIQADINATQPPLVCE